MILDCLENSIWKMAAEFSEKDVNLKIFVGELKDDATEEQLKAHFSENVGPVTVSLFPVFFPD